MITWSDLLWHMQRATLRTNKQTNTQQQQIWKAKVKNREHDALTSVFEFQDLAMLRTVSSFNSYLLLHNRLSQSVATKTICYFPQFLRVRNLLESSSGYLMWLSSVMGQPAGLSRNEGSTPKMAIGRRPWFIAKCVFPQGCLSVLMPLCPQSEWSQSDWPENEHIRSHSPKSHTVLPLYSIPWKWAIKFIPLSGRGELGSMSTKHMWVFRTTNHPCLYNLHFSWTTSDWISATCCYDVGTASSHSFL